MDRINGNKIPIKFNKVNGDFKISHMSLDSLSGFPNYVSGDLDISYNFLTSLIGCTKYVGGSFDCSHNFLKSLEGGPEVVESNYICTSNKLTNFIGCPIEINGFEADLNNIINFKGFPDFYNVKGQLSFEDNPISKIINPISNENKSKFIYWCNEYDAINDIGEIIPERMEEVYRHFPNYKKYLSI